MGRTYRLDSRLLRKRKQSSTQDNGSPNRPPTEPSSQTNARSEQPKRQWPASSKRLGANLDQSTQQKRKRGQPTWLCPTRDSPSRRPNNSPRSSRSTRTT